MEFRTTPGNLLRVPRHYPWFWRLIAFRENGQQGIRPLHRRRYPYQKSAPYPRDTIAVVAVQEGWILEKEHPDEDGGHPPTETCFPLLR